MDEKLSRRQALKISLWVLPAAAGGVALLEGCGSSSLDCSDTAGLAAPELATRTTLAYLEASPHGEEKDCVNCQLFTGNVSQCGTCTVVKGPINPRGYCNSWVLKPG